jgi:hypothetical protein
MRYLVLLATALVLTSGCALIFDDDGGSGGDDDVCAFDTPLPGAALPPQLNPETLTCESFGGGGGGCNPECGPCAELTAPARPWGFCGGTCEALSETACAADPACRVVKDAACAVYGDCTTDFLGCFPTNQFTVPELDCFAANDGAACSLSPACTAYHRDLPSGLETVFQRTFAMCTPEGKSPGACIGKVTCRAVAPACLPGTTPGIESGCYTGACIPLDVCGPILPFDVSGPMPF